MQGTKIGTYGRRTGVAGLFALSITSMSAQAITVDGDLSDLIGIVGANSFNVTSGIDPDGTISQLKGDGTFGTTEANNGFDIQNMYAYYDNLADTLFLGFDTYGTAGNSGAGDSDAANFGTVSFLGNLETYGFAIADGVGSQLYRFDVFGPNSALFMPASTTESNPFAAAVTASWAVDESLDGIEFSLVGLSNLTAIPSDLTIAFFAGSSENFLSEDFGSLSLQAVPVPAAVWLFGSGLLGLLGMARRRG